jgi:hypothetical protein
LTGWEGRAHSCTPTFDNFMTLLLKAKNDG